MLLLTPLRAQPSLICMVMSECVCVCVHSEARVQKVILISLQLVNACEGQVSLVITIIFFEKQIFLENSAVISTDLS